jgi:hypothetical protein
MSRGRAARALIALLLSAAARAGADVCALGQVAPDTVAVAIFNARAAACDLNHDGAVTAADVITAVAPLVQTPTPSATETPTPPATPTATPTSATPTASRPCPASGAALAVTIDNRSGVSPVAVELSGSRIADDCTAGTLATSYAVTIDCATDASTPCVQFAVLAPGMWSHAIRVVTPNTGQTQARQTLLVVDTTPNPLQFTAFADVLTVTKTADTGNGSLRPILEAAAAGAKPLLIQFDPVVFPAGTPTSITLTRELPPLATDEVTIDGTDASGAVGNRIIDANGLPTAALAVTGARNHLVGLHLRNAGSNNRDVLSISGSNADGNLVEQTIVEQAASADGIGVDQQAGKDFADTANVIRGCEVSGAADKGIKVTTGAYARIEHSWVHDNANGGIQATLGGHVQALANVVELNHGATAQNGLAANALDDPTMPSDFSELRTRGNISRANGANGISVRAFSIAELRDDFLTSNGSAGLRVFNDIGPPATADVSGVSAVCNGTDGAVVADTSVGDFGGGPSGSVGNNAFTQNNLAASGANLRNATSSLTSAINNQWEHCGTGPTCNPTPIAAYDLSDHGQYTTFSPAQAHRGQQPVVTSVDESKGQAGELLRIYGSGFDVIDGIFSQESGQCADVAGRNRCVPLRGNCVQINGVAAPVEAVTPTMLVVRWPFTCLAPVPLVVKTDRGAAGSVVSNTFTVCTNAPAN